MEIVEFLLANSSIVTAACPLSSIINTTSKSIKHIQLACMDLRCADRYWPYLIAFDGKA